MKGRGFFEFEVVLTATSGVNSSVNSGNFNILRILLFSLFVFGNLTLLPTEADVLSIPTGDGRPYIFVENNQIEFERPGFSIEILQSVARLQGWKLKFEVMPFSRQVIATRKGQVDGMIAIFKTDAPDLLFPNQPIGQASNCFFALDKSDFRFPDRTSLDDYKIGVTNGFTYGLVDQYIAENIGKNIISLSGDDKDVLTRLINMLQENRIDTFIEAETVVNYHLQEKGIKNIKNVGCTRTLKAFIAFSPSLQNSKKRITAFDQTVKQLRSSGQLQKILEKYGVKDWR